MTTEIMHKLALTIVDAKKLDGEISSGNERGQADFAQSVVNNIRQVIDSELDLIAQGAPALNRREALALKNLLWAGEALLGLNMLRNMPALENEALVNTVEKKGAHKLYDTFVSDYLKPCIDHFLNTFAGREGL